MAVYRRVWIQLMTKVHIGTNFSSRLELKFKLNAWIHFIFTYMSLKFGTLVAMSVFMIKWLIASYIIIVLILSANAHANHLESNPALNKLNHPVKKVQQLEVQDPLPDNSFETFHLMKFEPNTENFVG